MLSERMYWTILALSLVAFIAINVVWILPIVRDLAINLITDSIFAIFTIVFLTWIINTREAKQWNVVEKHILKRIVDRLYGMFDGIYCFFLEPIDIREDIPEQLKKRIDNPDFRIFYGAVAEYCATYGLEIGKEMAGFEFFNAPSDEDIDVIDDFFKDYGDFFEHIITGYSRFLPPELMHSLLEIIDSVELIRNTCSGMHIDIMVDKNFDKSHQEYFKKLRKKDMVNAISTISKEVHKLNTKGFGFTKANKHD